MLKCPANSGLTKAFNDRPHPYLGFNRAFSAQQLQEFVVDKSNFKENTRYTITWRTADGKMRPANIYVYKLFDNAMIARKTDSGGLLHKIAYTDVFKIVMEVAVEKEDYFTIPAAVLDEKVWKDRSVMERYSSSPHMGK